jgi:hypothetical protein
MWRKFKRQMKFVDKVLIILCLITISKNSAKANDSLKISRKCFQIGLNYGIPVYNKLSIYSALNYSDSYSVSSKLKSYYELSLTRRHNNFIYIFALSYLQSEFLGKEFNMNAYNDTIKPKSYKLYQHIKYNVLYANLGFGYNYQFNNRQQLCFNLTLNIPAIYDITITNTYSKSSQINDTTLFTASKNAKNWDTNFGRMPRVNLNLSYNYFLTSKIALNFNLSFLYAYTYGGHIPDDYKYETVFNHSNNYSYLAYRVRNQMVLTPSIGLRFATN